MDKQGFIEQLRRSLSAISDYTFVNDTIAYYENYIDCQMRGGKSEEEVMQELGDPRLIAKSIIASHTEDEEPGGSRERFFDDEENVHHGKNFRGGETVLHFNNRRFCMPTWLLKVLSICILALVLFVVFSFIGWLVPIFIRFGLPILIIYYLYRCFVKKT